MTPAKQVDVSQDPEVLEKAIEATHTTENFSSNTELADALEITNIRAMENMALYSLANRIKRFFYQAGWYAGYMVGILSAPKVTKTAENSIDVYARTMLKKSKAKARSSAATIRSMKVLTNLLSEGAYRNIGNGADITEVREDLTGIVNDALANGVEISPEVLEKAFRPGDLEKNPMIAHIINSMKEAKEQHT